jgi:competence protein ComEC
MFKNLNNSGMPLHDKAFWGIGFFLSGVLMASFLGDWSDRFLIAFFITILFVIFFLIFQKKNFAVFSFFIFLGSGYYFIFDLSQQNVIIPFNQKGEVQGIVRSVDYGITSQTIKFELLSPHKGYIQMSAARYPEYKYGDELLVRGSIKPITGKSTRFYEKENIFGRVSFAEIDIIDHNKGSKLYAGLLSIKRFTENAFNRVLPPEQAVFLSGLTLGETAAFSDEFKDQLSYTGTTHLVALSGYNITIIGKGIILVLGAWFSRKKTFIFTTVAIIGFVLMTGAEASVVRAAIMGFLVLLADRAERLYSFRNALSIAAFCMVLINPKILLFDVGFQLSFAAVMGLVYLRPAFARIFPFARKPGFLNWRENLMQTLSAQIAVLPILLSVFGSFSPISLITNVLVLLFIPITMLLGFLVAASAIVSSFISLVIAWIVQLFLYYELLIIEFFSKVPLQISITGFHIPMGIAYYALLIWFVVYSKKRAQIYAF